MEDWFHYNHIPKEKRLRYAVRQLAGDAHKWWIEEVDYRSFHNEPTITTWKELKTLLRDQYAPRHEVHTASPRKERVQKKSSAFHHSTDSPKPSKTPAKLSSKSQGEPPTACTVNPPPQPSVQQTDLMIETNQLSILSKSSVSEPEQLTNLEPVQPSNLVTNPQDIRDEPQKESSEGTRQSSSLETRVELPIQLVLEPVPILFPCHLPRKHFVGSTGIAGATELYILRKTFYQSLTLSLPSPLKTFEFSFNALGHRPSFVLMQGDRPIIYPIQTERAPLYDKSEFVQPPKGPDKPLVKHPGIFDPGTIIATELPGKETVVADTIVSRYVSLSVPTMSVLSFSVYPENEFLSDARFKRKTFSRFKGFIFDRDKAYIFACRRLYYYACFNHPCRVLSKNLQDEPDGRLIVYTPRPTIFHVWRKKTGAQAEPGMFKNVREGQQANPCRLIFDPGGNMNIRTKN